MKTPASETPSPDFPNVSPSPSATSSQLSPRPNCICTIEGTLTPEMKWQLAERNGVSLPLCQHQDMRAAQSFEAPDAPSYLKKFIQHYNEGMCGPSAH